MLGFFFFPQNDSRSLFLLTEKQPFDFIQLPGKWTDGGAAGHTGCFGRRRYGAVHEEQLVPRSLCVRLLRRDSSGSLVFFTLLEISRNRGRDVSLMDLKSFFLMKIKFKRDPELNRWWAFREDCGSSAVRPWRPGVQPVRLNRVCVGHGCAHRFRVASV